MKNIHCIASLVLPSCDKRNVFRTTDTLWGKSAGHPHNEPIMRNFDVFFLLAWTCCYTNSPFVGDFRRPCDISVMTSRLGFSNVVLKWHSSQSLLGFSKHLTCALLFCLTTAVMLYIVVNIKACEVAQNGSAGDFVAHIFFKKNVFKTSAKVFIKYKVVHQGRPVCYQKYIMSLHWYSPII